MKYVEDSDLPSWAKVAEQTPNFVTVELNQGWIELEKVEELFLLGLECCAVTAAAIDKIIICCKKV